MMFDVYVHNEWQSASQLDIKFYFHLDGAKNSVL